MNKCLSVKLAWVKIKISLTNSGDNFQKGLGPLVPSVKADEWRVPWVACIGRYTLSVQALPALFTSVVFSLILFPTGLKPAIFLFF